MKTNMKKVLLTLAAAMTLTIGARADEGMRLLPLLQKCRRLLRYCRLHISRTIRLRLTAW